MKNVVLSPEQAEHMKGYWPIVVFGVDSRDGNVHTGTNADVIMICNINRDTGEIKLVSVFRDTYLNISEKGTYNKINSAYSNGGAEQALAAINRNLDLDIQDYVTFNWKAVADGTICWAESMELISAKRNSVILTHLLRKPWKRREFLPFI